MSARIAVGTSARASKTLASDITNVRILELFFSVFESKNGLLHRQIHTLAPYQKYDDHSFNVTVARDFESLESMGVRIHIIPGTGTSDDSKRYIIDPSSVQSGAQVRLQAAQVKLIEAALASMPNLRPEQRNAFDYLLRARTDDLLDPSDIAVDSQVDEADGLSLILHAIDQKVPISFPYTPTGSSVSSVDHSLRAVEPWQILLRGQGMYLWGWDLDRQAPRLFRLTRIRGDVELIGEPGDCDHTQPTVGDPFARLLCSPVLGVRRGSVLPFAHELTELSESACAKGIEVEGSSYPSLPQGWVAYQGQEREKHIWLDRVIGYAHDVVLIEPVSLRQHILKAFAACGGPFNA